MFQYVKSVFHYYELGERVCAEKMSINFAAASQTVMKKELNIIMAG